jgi:hypothetical protein
MVKTHCDVRIVMQMCMMHPNKLLVFFPQSMKMSLKFFPNQIKTQENFSYLIGSVSIIKVISMISVANYVILGRTSHLQLVISCTMLI